MNGRRFLSDVVAQFSSLNRHGERIAVQHGFTSDFKDKRYSVFHTKGGRNNHFQGIQRVGNHLLVTGSFPYSSKRADLLVFRLASRPNDPGPWGSNMMRDRNPPEIDRLANYFKLDTDYWHPGGFALLDTVAAIPLENSDFQSKIVFVDVGTPESPVLRTTPVINREKHKAGACAITRLADGSVLLAAWSDSDKPPKKNKTAPCHLDIYTLDAGLTSFELAAQFFPSSEHDFNCKFQSMDFVWERTPAGVEVLYLIAFENTHEAQPHPTNAGTNRGLLFRVDLDAILAGGSASNPRLLADSDLQRAADPFVFETSGHWCNMDAGACAYVDSNQQLIVYSVYHFISPIRAERNTAPLVLKALEFRATRFAASIGKIEDGWIDLYEEPALQGRRLTLLGPWEASIEDSARVWSNDKPFGVAASVKYQLPNGHAFVLYRDLSFGGEAPLVLTGDGDVHEVDVIGAGFGGAFLSCRLQLESVAVALPGAIIV